MPLERVPGTKGRSNIADSIGVDKPSRLLHGGREGRGFQGVTFKIDEVELSSDLRNLYNKSVVPWTCRVRYRAGQGR